MNFERTEADVDDHVWMKSSYSSEQGGNCVEVASRPGVTFVRDSKDLSIGSVAVPAEAWAAFVGYAAARTVITS